MNKKRVLFTLTMPTCNSWNGRWSGEGVPYRKRMELKAETADKILADPYYRYRFSDGWVAGVVVEEITTAKQWKDARKTAGFAGYDWMINSIVEHQDIEYDRKN